MNKKNKRNVPVANFFIGEDQPLTVMCGPCVIESEEHAMHAAETLKKIFSKRKMNYIFKSSYDKANRSSIKSFRGVGIDEGIRILERIQRELGLPVVTDIHNPEEAAMAGQICDVLQIPAFLCRQTDLLLAAGNTGKVINVKKGQFMAPWDMGNVVQKIRSTGNDKVILVDRGTMFGYNYLINDMRCIPIMQQFGVPVCFDATHSVQLPGGKGESSGGEREFIAPLAKAAVAAGVDCLYMEAHPNPAQALSDADTVIDFKDLPPLLLKLEQLYDIVHER
jgi:2-dehydro-3-deoxyphosphooctonate aldolase (KDO 8-P synthase)